MNDANDHVILDCLPIAVGTVSEVFREPMFFNPLECHGRVTLVQFHAVGKTRRRN